MHLETLRKRLDLYLANYEKIDLLGDLTKTSRTLL